MNRLQTALAGFVGSGPTMGEGQEVRVEQFRLDLQAIAARNSRFILLPFIAIGVLLVLVIIGFIAYRAQPLKVSALIAAAGISIPWLIKEMAHLWSLKVQAETLLTLASTLDQEIMLSIAKTILKNMSAKPV